MTEQPASTTYASGRKRLTQAQEDYLKALFKLQEDHELVSTSELAQRLAISPASVSEMVTRLSSLGLVSHHRSHGQQLTAQGRTIAVELIRHHRLMEMFLVQILGFGWDEVHEEAERLEHVISERMEARIFDLLGRPRIDPHGDSIPTLEGALERSCDRTLETATAGERLRIDRVSDEDPVKLRAIEELGLVPAVECEVTEGSRYESPVTVRADGRQVSVPLGLARVIFVESA